MCRNCGFGLEMLQKGLPQGRVAVEHVHLVEGGWKMLLSLLPKGIVQ